MAKDPQIVNKGIFQDSNQEFQPESTYRFMLNGLFESLEGEIGGVVNERGNEILLPMPAGINDPHLNGTCLLPNQDVVLFITGNDSTNLGVNAGQDVQIIALHKNNDTYVELIRTNCLEYKRCNQIDCIFKVHNGCDIILYFTDHVSKYKSINITAIENETARYIDDNHVDYLAGTNPNIPSVNPATSIGNYGWLCNAFYLSPVSTQPDIFLHKVSNSGNLRVGTYTFFVRLLDSDLNPTNWLSWSNPITIKQGPFNGNSPPDNTDGTYIDPTIANFTSKSISLVLNNLDETFSYYEIGVMERSLNLNVPSFTYRSGQRLISGPTDVFLFNNVNDTRWVDIDISVLLTKNRQVDVVQAHTQIDNRLILGNIKNEVRDWYKFQQAANDIKTEYFTYSKVDISNNGCDAKHHHVVTGPEALDPGYELVNYSNPEFLSYGMSLMRDEVYALGIIYVFKDGSESPVFHIPGRPKFGTVETTTYIIDGYDYADYARTMIHTMSNSLTNQLQGAVLLPNILDFDNQQLSLNEPHTGAKGSWESDRMGNLPQRNSDILDIGADDYKYLYGWSDSITCCYNIDFSSNSCGNTGLERWQYYNTAIRRKVDYDGTFGEIYESKLRVEVKVPLLSLPPHNPPTTIGNTSYSVTYTIDGGSPLVYNSPSPAPIGFTDIVTTTGVLAFVSMVITNDNHTGRPVDPPTIIGPTYVSGYPTLAETVWNSLDDVTNLQAGPLSNPYYTFTTGFRGVPGYYDTGINYPNILDCEGNRVFPEGNVRHHKMPDHRIEQLFDNKGSLGLNTVVGGGQITSPAWLASSNITPVGVTDTNTLYGVTGIDPRPWQMNDAESCMQLYPLGLNFHNVTVPDEFREEVQGYYIVRSDRANNKTVIDKGFMNVADTTISSRNWDGGLYGSEAIDDYVNLIEDRVYTNNLFLTPHHRPHTGFTVGREKKPTNAWWNILEMHTPKSTYNEPVLLSADYIKLESALFGDMFFDNDNGVGLTPDSYVEEIAGLGINPSAGWNTAMSVVLNQHKYPRVQSPRDRYIWSFVYNIPISGMSYVGWNSVTGTNALGNGNIELYNSDYRQKTLMLKHYQSCIAVEPISATDLNSVLNIKDGPSNLAYRSVCDIQFPFHYDALKKDILHDGPSNESFYIDGPGPAIRDLDLLIRSSNSSTTYAGYLAWSRNTNVTSKYKWSVPHSPYMYYASLKSTIRPYEDFDSLKYIKMHSYVIPADPILSATQSFAVTGGDTFINRFQFEKGRWEIASNDLINNPPANTWTKFITTLTVGYVESEINTMFRYLQDGDLFRSFPFNARNAYYGFLSTINSLAVSGGGSGGGTAARTSMDGLQEKQIIYSRYKLDYSSYNSEIPSFQLPSTWDYCSNCSESFPNTLIYSNISLDSQVQDFYKIFLTNSEKNIPSSTGSIQNMFVKNSDLYIHTEHNLWKISVAPQTMQTNSDTVEVGQGAFLDRDPIRLFNNKDAFSRGGCVDKFTSVYGAGEYIWLDRNSASVLSLGEGINSLSDTGLTRWFANNIEVNLDNQFMSYTGLSYPFKGTACNKNVGFIATLDPEHDRYILSKKDYSLLPEVTDTIIELTTNALGTLFSPATVIDQYYYDDEGFYKGIAVGTDVNLKDTLVEYLDLTDPVIAKNKSWTISYSLKNKAWTSWHSYLPNWLYNDSYTFYSFLTSTGTTINENIYRHNYGEFQNYYGSKYDFILDYIYKKEPIMDKTYDSIEYTSNVWKKSLVDDTWIEIPFVTFDRFFVYNNTQLSNLKTITVGNLTPYSNIPYSVSNATAQIWRNNWKINRLRDMAVDRLLLNEPKFTTDWNESTYQSEFTNGGYIDHVINPNMIDVTKNVYQIERLTDKYLGTRLFFKPDEDYKITFNLNTGLYRNKI